MKGAARTAAADHFAAICEEIEVFAKRGDRQAAAALRVRFECSFNELKNHIERNYA